MTKRGRDLFVKHVPMALAVGVSELWRKKFLLNKKLSEHCYSPPSDHGKV